MYAFMVCCGKTNILFFGNAEYSILAAHLGLIRSQIPYKVAVCKLCRPEDVQATV